MDERILGRTGWKLYPIGLGTWAMGGSWGTVDDAASLRALHQALDLGVNFFDTADVYGDGRSERLLAQLHRERSEPFYIATKAGRRLDPHTPEGYNRANLRAFIERSLRNLQTDTIDLLQLHCPPTPVYSNPEVFGVLDEMVRDGKIRYYGVSVETVAEALKAIEYPGVQSVQIIFNIFRQKPAEEFFAAARQRRVGILARVPLASGLLTGKITAQTTFAPDDHRSFNRHGEAFDMGETFSGVDFNVALKAVDVLQALVPVDESMAVFALRWILMFDEITCVIPGGRKPEQVQENTAAAQLPPLTPETMARVREVYDTYIRPLVHTRW